MKKNLIIAVLLLATGLNTVCAQNDVNLVTKKVRALDRKYLRPSLTKLYISDGTNTADQAINSLKEAEEDEKFDYNNVKNDVFHIGSIPIDKGQRKKVITSFIENLLAQEKIPNQIMHCWFPTDENGELSIEKLVKRGKYAATDADVNNSKASKRNTMLNELGEQLIDRSYIIAYIVEEIISKDSKGNVEYKANITPYVYKLNFDNDTRSTFYDNYYSASGIDQMTFPTEYVKGAERGISCSAESAAAVYDDIMYLLRKVADFQVKTPITFTHPIRANIGKKEGVTCDKRYAVMRLIEDKNGERKAQRVATVRATNKILDNRNIANGQVSEDRQTKFYEIKGRQIMPGETLVENTDLGLNISAEYTISEASLAAEYRLGKNIKIPGFFVYLKAGMPWSKGLGGIKIMAADKDGEWKSFQVLEVSLGFAKEFNFAGTFALTASIEGGYLIAGGAKETWYENNQWNYDKDKNFDSESYKIGAHLKFGYYMTRNIQLYANIGYNYYIKSDKFIALQEFWANSEKSNRHKIQKFEPLAFGLGLKVGF